MVPDVIQHGIFSVTNKYCQVKKVESESIQIFTAILQEMQEEAK